MRIGQGYDAHCFIADKPLLLGGVTIPYHSGLLAHSDGDVLIHAICDALLGALALGDIGQHFSDQDAAYKNIDSRLLLKKVNDLIQAKGYQLVNLDATVVAQEPELAKHIPDMRKNLSADLGVAIDQVSIKATTTEKMGFQGKLEGISAQAVVLMDER
jgi:2-C-methyl-D-erythritol 2,4-cyclodiphosphate synthase